MDQQYGQQQQQQFGQQEQYMQMQGGQGQMWGQGADDAKRMRIDNGPPIGEVRFETAVAAQMAVQHLNGLQIHGMQVIVELDQQEASKVIVRNLPESINWDEIREQFGSIGPVVSAGFQG